MTQFLSTWVEINACTACSDFNPGGHDFYPLYYQLNFWGWFLYWTVLVILGGCFTPIMKSSLRSPLEHRNKEGSFYTKRDLKNWCWFLANHQYPSKTSRLMESLNYLFWKMILLEKPAEDRSTIDCWSQWTALCSADFPFSNKAFTCRTSAQYFQKAEFSSEHFECRVLYSTETPKRTETRSKLQRGTCFREVTGTMPTTSIKAPEMLWTSHIVNKLEEHSHFT